MARVRSNAGGKASRVRRRKLFRIYDQPAHDFPYDFVGERDLYSDGCWWGSGFRHYPATPVFQSVNGNTNRDFWNYCFYWFISDRMKAILESVDPDAFEFLKCKVLLPDGTDGPVRWMCDIVRVLDALDEEKSAVKIEANSLGEKMYGILPQPLVFKDDAVGPHHIFRMQYSQDVAICDEELRLACKAAGLKGTSFDEITRPPKWATIPKEVLEEHEASYRGPTLLQELPRDCLLKFGDDLKTVAPALAARCGLRALPLLERLSWGKPQRKRVRAGKRVSISMSAIAQGRFRSVATAWVAARFPAFGKGDRLREMRHQAEWVGGDATTRGAMLAAFLAFDDGVTEESRLREYMTSHCMTTAYHAAHDFMEFYDPEAMKRFYGPRGSLAGWEPCEAELAISNAVLEDIRRLEQGESVQSLLEQSLWLTPAPQYVLDDWRNLSARLLGRSDEHWKVWVDWYAARLTGGTSVSEKDEIARVSLPDEVWNQGVAIANARVAELAS